MPQTDLIKDIDNIFIEYHSLQKKKQGLHDILKIIAGAGFRYHITEAYTNYSPFVNRTTNYGMDLQLNTFCYKED
jgi:hypothetical protein